MKNKLILLLLFSNLLFSQQQYSVKYAVVATNGTIENYILPDNSELMRNTALKLYKDADKTLQLLEYELIVNDNKSIFKLLTKSTPEFKLNILAVGLASKDDIYCTNNEILRHIKIGIENLIVTSSFEKKWTLLNEFKIIDGNKCFKATYEKPWGGLPELNGNKPNYTITAWYCPKILANFGPKGYGGLPGLIFELQDSKITFIAKSIKYDNIEPVDFTKIDKMKHLTQEEYTRKQDDFSSMIGIK